MAVSGKRWEAWHGDKKVKKCVFCYGKVSCSLRLRLLCVLSCALFSSGLEL